MSEFFQARICLHRMEAPDSTHLSIDLEATVQETYQKPGQYAVLRLPHHKDGFFAFASAPKEPWSFLIKKSSPLTDALANLEKGKTLLVSKAQGQGFDLTKIAGKNSNLICVGSGIAPMRAILRHILKNGQRDPISLYYGTKNREGMAYTKDLEDWKSREVQVINVFSREKPTPGLLTGYVQDHLRISNPVKTVALLCGMKAMIDDVTQKLITLGLSKEQILTNF